MVITTVSDTQDQILHDIAVLHNGGRRYHVDLTFSTGKFWTGPGAVEFLPRVRMDLTPQHPATTLQANFHHLPFLPGSVESFVFDPPYMHAPGKDSIMGQRFGGYPSQAELWHSYKQVIDEVHYSLRRNGLLVFKCQDIVESGKQVWNHWKIMTYCFTAYNFVLEDLFILTKKGQIAGHNHGRQQHARRAHSYFLVLRKAK